jgi:hypothetical protein
MKMSRLYCGSFCTISVRNVPSSFCGKDHILRSKFSSLTHLLRSIKAPLQIGSFVYTHHYHGRCIFVHGYSTNSVESDEPLRHRRRMLLTRDVKICTSAAAPPPRSRLGRHVTSETKTIRPTLDVCFSLSVHPSVSK